MAGNWGLIDLETPKDAYTVPSWRDSTQNMQLVFSDEFNTDGRSFYPGDDPYWEAVDLHYWVRRLLVQHPFIRPPEKHLSLMDGWTVVSPRLRIIWSGTIQRLSRHPMARSSSHSPKKTPMA